MYSISMTEIDTQAKLTCPECGATYDVVMPTEQKQHFFKCSNEQCNANIATNENECCVFCSHADKPCPSKQVNPEEGHKKPKLRSLI